MPKITFILPVYKVEKYLARVKDALLSQTLTDFEAIFVDDGSPDASGAICDAFAKEDSRLRVIHKKTAVLLRHAMLRWILQAATISFSRPGRFHRTGHCRNACSGCGQGKR